MRHWIVDRMLTFPMLYKLKGMSEEFSKYCEKMAKKGTAGSYLELQVASDIFFVIVEIYKTDNLEEPYQVIMPLRSKTVLAIQCKRRIKVLIQNNNHCVALDYPSDRICVLYTSPSPRD